MSYTAKQSPYTNKTGYQKKTSPFSSITSIYEKIKEVILYWATEDSEYVVDHNNNKIVFFEQQAKYQDKDVPYTEREAHTNKTSPYTEKQEYDQKESPYNKINDTYVR